MFQTLPINGETWLICGGRDFRDYAMFNQAMGELTAMKGLPSKIVHGACRWPDIDGADKLADEFARRFALEVEPVPVTKEDWNKHGKKAGPLRNQHMLDWHNPKLVVAFPGGNGTADMVNRAHKAGIDVAEIKPQKGHRPMRRA